MPKLAIEEVVAREGDGGESSQSHATFSSRRKKEGKKERKARRQAGRKEGRKREGGREEGKGTAKPKVSLAARSLTRAACPHARARTLARHGEVKALWLDMGSVTIGTNDDGVPCPFLPRSLNS